MQGLKARVVNGRLVVDQPTALPEGTELDLTIVEPGDDLDDEERAALHAALAQAWDSARSGKSSPAEDLLRKLRTDR
jgi:hypothetical protein